eukprot:gb/GECG01003889.1/.p1 GENE.gb/GECG01003889.1/~~gb/GECG01003889.1/.p1  ORF type:complete len:522 (+),score=37.59 gb/GECG01003889.1/:1-1566(+)
MDKEKKPEATMGAPAENNTSNTGEAQPRTRKLKSKLSGRKHMLTHRDVQDHLLEEYIYTGYRGEVDLKGAFRSIFEIHNETMNIWTHLIGMIIFVTLAGHLLYIELSYLQDTSPAETVAELETQQPSEVVAEIAATLAGRAQCVGWESEKAVSTFSCDRFQSCEYSVLSGGIYTHSFGVAQMSLPPTFSQARSSFVNIRRLTRDIRSKLSYTRDLTSNSVRTARIHLLETLDRVETRWQAVQNSLLSLSNGALENAAVRSRRGLDAVAGRIRSVCRKAQKLGRKHASASMDQLYSAGEMLNSLSSEALAYIAYQKDVTTTKWPIFVFMGSAVTCLACSVTFHWFCVVSQEWYNRLVKIDYAGINVLIAGSAVPIIYYGFSCDTFWRTAHFAIFGTACLASTTCIVVPYFSKPSFAPLRVGVFIGTGLFGVIPVIHMLYMNYDLELELLLPAVWHLVAMGTFYILGAVLYAVRIPERFTPGHFDILFASHQIFHVMVVVAALIHYSGVQRLLEWYEHASLHC